MSTSMQMIRARGGRSEHLVRYLNGALRRAAYRVQAWGAAIAEARRHRLELNTLLRADDRMLRDIGLARGDVRFAAMHGQELGAREALDSPAARLEEARSVAGTRLRSLPHIDAPTLVAGWPQPTKHGNFR